MAKEDDSAKDAVPSKSPKNEPVKEPVNDDPVTTVISAKDPEN